MVDVILPAGGRISGEFAAEAGVEIKALISLQGATVLERTISVLRATPGVGRVIVIGPAELRAHPAARGAEAVLSETESGPSNIMRGLEWLRGGGGLPARALILTTDLPFLSAPAMGEFLEACDPDADISVPLVRREVFEARFPGFDTTYVRLRDGEWTMGCAFLVNPEALLTNRHHVERVFAARKSQLQMARLLGVSFVWRFLTRRLTMGDVEARCVAILGCCGKALLESPPELAFDIDLPREYRYAMAQTSSE